MDERASLFPDPEVAAVMGALVYFAPSHQVTVDPFGRALLRAAELLAEGGVTLSGNDLREWVEKWPNVR